jgi:hypothetical protein
MIDAWVLAVMLYPWTDLVVLQIYSSARVGALVGMILCLSGMDVTTPINCQVSTVFYVRPSLCL